MEGALNVCCASGLTHEVMELARILKSHNYTWTQLLYSDGQMFHIVDEESPGAM
jgi:hypothetical protein